MPPIAEQVATILLKDREGRPVGVVIRNGHWVFYKVEEMSDDDITELFPKPLPAQAS